MAVYRCKMCGDKLNITEGMTVCECEYCGLKQTVPSADNEKKMALFARGNKLLHNCEYDKAAAVFESIIADFPEEAEAYLGKLMAMDKTPDFASWIVMQKEKRLNELSAERLLTRAKQYAKGTTQKQIEDGLAEIESVLDQRIADAQEAEQAEKKRKMIIGIAVAAVAACITFVIVFTQAILSTQKFSNEVSALTGVSVGDTVTYGTYHGEDIEWLVLDVNGKRALIISKYTLDCQPYNTSYESVTWASCSLRKWLNGTFYNHAFSSKEQSIIATTTVTADKNTEYSTDAGNDTQDQVFLLSIQEAEKYFSSDSARQCAPTEYAIKQGAYTNDGYKTADGKAACWWWLRSPGLRGSSAADVNSGGSVLYGGDYVDGGYDCVRPALWINLGS